MSDDWGNWDKPFSIEDFKEYIEEIKKAPIKSERHLIHVTKCLIDVFEKRGILLNLQHCQLVGSPEAIAYAKERVQIVLKEKK
ncbi:MAG: hypothetical protein ACTSW7_00735 [Candidatus Thorarchaeota archaeon]|nr:hypothetical protein [Thermoplasmatales archaeon]